MDAVPLPEDPIPPSVPVVTEDIVAKELEAANLAMEAAIKAAAAQAAQLTAATAQQIANDYQRSADEAKAITVKLVEDGKADLRDLAHQASETVIQILKKVNSNSSS